MNFDIYLLKMWSIIHARGNISIELKVSKISDLYI